MESEEQKYFEVKFNTIETENENYYYVKVVGKDDLPIPKKKTVLALIDKSGSMEGENIEHTKSVVKKLLSFFRENMLDASVNFITFDIVQELIKDANKIDKSKIEKL
jgi:uncharacterized protein with von Willebrand factor type A (vWA) domain